MELLLKARYSEGEDVDIESDAKGFNMLASGISNFVVTGNSKFEQTITQSVDPSPYDCFLSSIVFSVAENNLIYVDDMSQLQIRGDKRLFESIAMNLRNYKGMSASEPTNHHCHYDWISFPELLPENSLGLVIRLRN